MVVLTNFPPPTEGIKHQQPLTGAVVNDRALGLGTLYIAESRLSWVSNQTQQGFSVEYPHVAVHAISRDTEAYPHECLYVMIDTNIDTAGVDTSDSSDDDEDDENNITEMRFVPEDKGMLEAMYQAMSLCQTLHPDEPQSSYADNDDDDEEQFEDADSEGEYVTENDVYNAALEDCSNGIRQNGRITDDAMDVEDGQFEDADSSTED